MEEIKSCPYDDLHSVQSESREDIQFGTVSEILTVSSSVQVESATHGETASLKVGVSLDEVPCNDFKPVKVKKANSKSRMIANQIVTHNKFQLLAEEKDIKMKETETHDIRLESEVFNRSTSKIPWKTVLNSKQGYRKNKILKYSLNHLKKFETRNRFSLLENISEENVTSVLNRIQEIKFIQTLKKADIKRCHSCNYKKRSCMIDRSSCSAVDKVCVLCKKIGHFPKSLKCKKYKGIKSINKNKFSCQSTSQPFYVHTEEEEN